MRRILPPLVIALAAAGCGAESAPPPAPPTVTVGQPERREVHMTAEFTGTMRAIEAVEVRARVTGRLEAMNFAPSDLVEKGQSLFTIEQETYRAGVQEAEGRLKSARANLDRAEADLERIEQAIQTQAVSEQDRDRARADVLQGEASVLEAQAALDRASLDLEYTRVLSPISGRASRNLVDPGNIVSGTERTLLTTVRRMDQLYVYFNVPERVVLAMKRMDREIADHPEEVSDQDPDEPLVRVEVRADGETAFGHEGIIDFVDNTVDPITGTIEIRGLIPNPDEALVPGIFVRVRVTARESREEVVVSEAAVGTDIGGKYVYVVGPDDVVEQRYVTLGRVMDDGMVVVSDGLEGAETYIVNGLLRARPGLPVNPQTAAAGSGE
jgi:RND family efflux transporter MFP subunit